MLIKFIMTLHSNAPDFLKYEAEGFNLAIS